MSRSMLVNAFVPDPMTAALPWANEMLSELEKCGSTCATQISRAVGAKQRHVLSSVGHASVGRHC